MKPLLIMGGITIALVAILIVLTLWACCMVAGRTDEEGAP